MGTWSSENFGNDAALDLVCSVANNVKKELAAPSGVEDLELVMAAVAILKALIEHCHAPRPDSSEIIALRDKVLAIYDAEIDELDPSPEFKAERRKVIEQTFDEFLALIHH
jgi:hypothetical protein